MNNLFVSLSILIMLTILFVPQTVFSITSYQNISNNNYENTKKTSIEYDGGKIIINQISDKLEYKIGETVTIKPQLVNIGDKNMTIIHYSPLFATEVKYQNGSKAWPSLSQAVTMEPWTEVTLRPGITLEENYSYQNLNPIKLTIPGKYDVRSVAYLTIYDKEKQSLKDAFLNSTYILRSKPLQITILPENYENETNSSMTKISEFSFAVPILLVSITSLILLYRIKFR